MSRAGRRRRRQRGGHSKGSMGCRAHAARRRRHSQPAGPRRARGDRRLSPQGPQGRQALGRTPRSSSTSLSPSPSPSSAAAAAASAGTSALVSSSTVAKLDLHESMPAELSSSSPTALLHAPDNVLSSNALMSWRMPMLGTSVGGMIARVKGDVSCRWNQAAIA